MAEKQRKEHLLSLSQLVFEYPLADGQDSYSGHRFRLRSWESFTAAPFSAPASVFYPPLAWASHIITSLATGSESSEDPAESAGHPGGRAAPKQIPGH